MNEKPKVLFLCTGNSCRSQMAEGWARHLKSDVLEPYSAGIETHGLNPRAVAAMAEAGVDISGHRSTHLDELADVKFDYVVTVCAHAHESCPVFPGQAQVVHVGFDDPPALSRDAATEDEAMGPYRRVRDEIRAFVATLPVALTAGKGNGHGV
jgi:arsenate reductase